MAEQQAQVLSRTKEVQLFLYRADTAQGLQEIIAELQRLVNDLDNTINSELSVNDIGDGSDTIAGEVDSAPDLPEVVLSLHGDDAAQTQDAAGALLSAVRGDVDPSRSSALVCDRLQILPGQEPVRIYYGLRRLQALTREEFQHYWLHHHADVGRQLIPPYSYFQSHTDTDQTTSFAARCGLPVSTLDGVVAVHFPDLAACQRQLARDDVGDIAIEDERRFIDHERVEFGIFSVR